jgi:hypothetical protein
MEAREHIRIQGPVSWESALGSIGCLNSLFQSQRELRVGFLHLHTEVCRTSLHILSCSTPGILWRWMVSVLCVHPCQVHFVNLRELQILGMCSPKSVPVRTHSTQMKTSELLARIIVMGVKRWLGLRMPARFPA